MSIILHKVAPQLAKLVCNSNNYTVIYTKVSDIPIVYEDCTPTNITVGAPPCRKFLQPHFLRCDSHWLLHAPAALHALRGAASCGLTGPTRSGAHFNDRFSWEEFWGSNCSRFNMNLIEFMNDVSLSIFSVLVMLLLLEETPLSFPFV